ncbi:MAG: hypothetical protein WC326_07650 [Candidatus Delongbacteria bacterium]
MPCFVPLPKSWNPWLRLGPALLVLGGLQACSEEESSEETGLRLALVEGTVLGYELREVWTYHDLADTTAALGGDSLWAYVSQTVAEAGALYGQPARRVRERTDWFEWDNSLQPVLTENADLYYQERDEALLLLASSGPYTLTLGQPGPGFCLPRDGTLTRGGLLPGRDAPAATKTQRFGDDIYLEDPPLVVLLYPLEVDLQWSYRQAGYPWRIDKRVTALGPADPDSLGERECVSTEWWFDLDRDEVWDTDTRLSSVMDERGLVRSVLVQEDLRVTDPETNLQLGATRRVELWRVTDSTLDD